MSINSSFFQWLSGYLDGKANFQVTIYDRQVFRNKVVNTKGVMTHYGVGIGFHLKRSSIATQPWSVHIRDSDLLVQLQELFSALHGSTVIGKLYKYKHKNEAHYAITCLADLKWFIENVLDKCTLFTLYQSKRFRLLRHCVMNNIKRVETLEDFNQLLTLSNSFAITHRLLTNNYIIGFINRKATFTTVPTGTAKFAIEHTGGKVIKINLGFSTNVYAPTQRSGRKQTYAISVTNSLDLAIVIDLIKSSYPLKLIQYNNWIENHIGVDWDYKQYLKT